MDIDFKKLIQLQSLDAQIIKLSFSLDNIPHQLKEIDEEIELLEKTVEKTKEKLAQNQKARRELEAEIQDIQSEIVKLQRQLNDVKTNLEYSSLLKKIDNAKQKKDILEEDEIGKLLQADEISAEIQSAVKKAALEKDELQTRKDTLKAEQVEMENRRKELMQDKAALIPLLPSEQVNLYEKIYKRMNGIALSPVTDDFCSMCQIRVRPQVLNELKAENKIIICENCGRILYWSQEDGWQESTV